MKSQEHMPYHSFAGESSGPVKCFLMVTQERTWLGRNQAMNEMNRRGLISQECAVAIGKLFLLSELGSAIRSRTVAEAR